MEKGLRGYFDRVGINRICDLLSAGGIAVFPTDTIYGFHCLATDQAAVEKIRFLKGNRKKIGFVLLFSDIEMVAGWVLSWEKDSREILNSIWPAPLTAILMAAKSVDFGLKHRGAIAIRIPAKRELRDIIDNIGGPIISTSVNRSGNFPLTRISEIISTFPGLSVYISRKGRNHDLPSTLVDFRISPPQVLRHGAYNWI
ncbi:threonylcarbamoyl-AMP synthase [bacterium]|nr:threonylcarbamoyl-AMP synthase [bacterium]